MRTTIWKSDCLSEKQSDIANCVGRRFGSLHTTICGPTDSMGVVVGQEPSGFAV